MSQVYEGSSQITEDDEVTCHNCGETQFNCRQLIVPMSAAVLQCCSAAVPHLPSCHAAAAVITSLSAAAAPGQLPPLQCYRRLYHCSYCSYLMTAAGAAARHINHHHLAGGQAQSVARLLQPITLPNCFAGLGLANRKNKKHLKVQTHALTGKIMHIAHLHDLRDDWPCICHIFGYILGTYTRRMVIYLNFKNSLGRPRLKMHVYIALCGFFAGSTAKLCVCVNRK